MNESAGEQKSGRDDLTASIQEHLNASQGHCSGAEIHASSAEILADLQERYAIDRAEAERQLEGWLSGPRRSG